MSSRAGKKRLREVHQVGTRSASTVQRPSIRRRLNSLNVQPSSHTQKAIAAQQAKSVEPPASDFKFQFTHELRTVLDELSEPGPPAPQPDALAADIRLSTVDEDLEDVILNHSGSGKVRTRSNIYIRLFNHE